MISFNEYLNEDISSDMKKAFSVKEKNNLKGLFGKLNIKVENLVFKKTDKNVITSYPTSKKEQVIIVKSDWKGKDYRGDYTNNFIICDFPKNHTIGVFRDISKSFYNASFEKNTYTLDNIKEHALEVWVAEVGEAEDTGAGAKIKPELSFMGNYELLLLKAKVKIKEVASGSLDLNDFHILSYDFKTLYERLKEYKELGEKFDKRAISKEELKQIEHAFTWVNDKIEKFGKL
jgi:hypothetical protein